MIRLTLLSLLLTAMGAYQICRPESVLFGRRWQLRDGDQAELSDAGRRGARSSGAFMVLLGVAGLCLVIGMGLADRRKERESDERAAVHAVWGISALPDDLFDDGRGLTLGAIGPLQVLRSGEIGVTRLDERPQVSSSSVWEVRFGVEGSSGLDPEVLVNDDPVITFDDVPDGGLVLGVWSDRFCTITEVQVWESGTEVVVAPVQEYDNPLPISSSISPPSSSESEGTSMVDECSSGYPDYLTLVPVGLDQPLGDRTLIDGRSGEPAVPVRSDDL